MYNILFPVFWRFFPKVPTVLSECQVYTGHPKVLSGYSSTVWAREPVVTGVENQLWYQMFFDAGTLFS
jgi:hypothetical protein